MRNVWLSFIVSQCVGLELRSENKKTKGVYFHIEGHFGPSANAMNQEFTHSEIVEARPDLAACKPLDPDYVKDKVVLILRGPTTVNRTYGSTDLSCRFAQKVYNAQQAGAKGVIIGNNVGMHDIVPMYKDQEDTQTIKIPSMAVSRATFEVVYKAVTNGERFKIRMNELGAIDDMDYNYIIQRWITAILSTLMLLASVSLIIAGVLSFKTVIDKIREYMGIRERRNRVSRIPTVKYSAEMVIDQDKIVKVDVPITTKRGRTIFRSKWTDSTSDSVINHANDANINDTNDDENENDGSNIGSIDQENVVLIESNIEKQKRVLHNEMCYVCLEDFIEGEDIKLLRCKHGFHDKCIKTWIIKKGLCPVCKRPVFLNRLREHLNHYMHV